ncbi:MAG: hypothetical protein HY901_02665, partial [Deltaproteobacteria bacterium]|nr:hypothetical protein [Deltaproteobacteria bacterium]
AAERAFPSRIAAPGVSAATALLVEEEALTLDCKGEGGQPVCRFEAAYSVFNPTRAAERVVGAFYGERAAQVLVEADGRPIGRELSLEETRSLDAATEAALKRRADARPLAPKLAGPKMLRFGFELEVASGQRIRLLARGRLEPGERFVPSAYSYPATQARHLLLGTRSRARYWDLGYLIAPLWTWKGQPSLRVELRVDEPFIVEKPPGEGWRSETRDGRTILSREFAGGSAEVPMELSFLFKSPPPLLQNGGPLLGVGGAFGEHGGLRARLGYEVATHGWLLVSVVAETDFADRIQLVPAVEAASPAVFFVPSLGVGLGLPVHLQPDPRAGARLQGSAMLYPVGALLAVDLYPRSETGDSFIEVSLMFQGSL